MRNPRLKRKYLYSLYSEEFPFSESETLITTGSVKWSNRNGVVATNKKRFLSFSFNNWSTRICPIHSSPVRDIYQLENRFASTGPTQVCVDMLRLLPTIFQVLLVTSSRLQQDRRNRDAREK